MRSEDLMEEMGVCVRGVERLRFIDIVTCDPALHQWSCRTQYFRSIVTVTRTVNMLYYRQTSQLHCYN